MTKLSDDRFSCKEHAHDWSLADKTVMLDYAGDVVAGLDPLAPAPSITFQVRLNGILYRGTLHLVKEEEGTDNDATI